MRFCFTPLLALLLAGVTHAATIHVDAAHTGCPGSGTPSDPFCTVQAAIDAAVSGDTILVAPGTYIENLSIQAKSLTIRSTGGPESTVIDGNRVFTTVQFAAGANSRLEGFTITGGGATIGGGIYCLISSPVIVGNTITGNVGAFGGGIYVSPGSAPQIESNTISTNNSAYGGGIDCRGAATILGNVVFDNFSSQGGGFHIGGESPVLVNNTVTDNVASSSYGAALHVSAGTPLLVNDILWGNGFGSEVVVTSGAATIAYCDVRGGYAGSGNFDADPLFIDAPSRDYRLTCGSPCRDTGASPGIPLPAFDHSGSDLRSIGPLDVGADEVGIFWSLIGAPVAGGPPVHFELRGADSHPAPALAEVLSSLGDGSSSGGLLVPGSGGRRIGLDSSPLLSTWLGLPPVLRQAGPIQCSGATTFPISIPASAPIGLTVYAAGLSWDLSSGNVVSLSETESIVLQ
ncbi:MAG: right-handed parallel beta-helix repeat-containing protein [Planctomycetota bacterium]